jgi:hypothetical protein
LLGKSLSILFGDVPRIQMVSDFVHQDIAEIKPMKPNQIGPSKGVGVEKDAAPPVVTVKSSRTSPTPQLLPGS